MSNNKFKVIYENLNPDEITMIEEMKDTASKLCDLFYATQANREMALALTNLEQAMMWAIKGVCINSERRYNQSINTN
jgi:hypothetical protein